MQTPSTATATAFTRALTSHKEIIKKYLILGTLSVLTNAMLAALPPNATSGLFALFFFCAYALAFCFIDAMTFILLMPIIIGRFAMFVSGALIEFGSYLPEIGVLGQPSGAFFHLNIAVTVFLTVTAVAINSLRPRMQYYASTAQRALLSDATSVRIWMWASLGILVAYVAYMFLIGIVNGFPIIAGVGRSVFMHSLDDPIYNAFQGNRPIISVFLGLLYAASNILRPAKPMLARQVSLVGIGGIIALIAVSILFSEKFTSIVLNISYFAAPSIVARSLTAGVSIWRVVGLLLVVGLITTPVVLTVYGALSNAGEAWQQFSERAAASGQLWQVTYLQVNDLLHFDIKAIKDEIALMRNLNADDVGFRNYKGLFYFMLHYKPTGLLDNFFEADGSISTFTYAFEAYLLVLLGRLGMMLPLVIYAVMLGAALGWLTYSMCRFSFIRCFVTMKLVIFFASGLASGNLWVLSGTKAIIAVVLIILTELVLYFYGSLKLEHKSIRA